MRFKLIDKIDRLDLGRSAEGHKLIAPDEDYFRDHFPGYPLVPGVLVLESLAQLGGRLVEASVRHATGRRVLPMLTRFDRARLFRQVRPAERLDLFVEIVALGDDAARVTGTARVGGQKTAIAEIMYAMLDLAETTGHVNAEQLAALHEWSDRLWAELKGKE